MSGAFEPPPGDPDRLTRSATRLGETAGSVGALAESFDRGAALTALAVMRSESAPRIDEMTNGLRGMRAELDRLRACGEQVADVVRDLAGRQQRLEDDLAHLATQAGRRPPAPDSSPDLEDAAHDARRAFADAEVRAATEIDRLTRRLDAPEHADLVSIERVELDQANGRFTATRAWAGVDGAFETIAAAEHRANQATASYQILGGIAGFYEAGEVTVTALAHPVASCLALGDLGAHAARDPAGTARQLWRGFRDPYVADWRAGDRGKAIGRGLEYALELAVGSKGLGEVSRTPALDTPRRVLRQAPAPVPGPLSWPEVSEPKLQNYVRDLYKGTLRPGHVGAGTTMDAIRHELATGMPTAGRMHVIKGREYARGLSRWLARNPSASQHDRLVASSLLSDLLDALEEEK